MTPRLLLPMPGNAALASRLVENDTLELAAATFRHFPDGERYVRVDCDVAHRTVDILCSLAPADRHFLTLAFVADALRDLGAARVNLVAPYLGYLRQDARFQPGEAVTSRTFARLLGSVVDRLVTIDPHLHRFATLSDLYAIPAQAVASAPLVGAWIGQEIKAPLVIGPDAESEQWAREVARFAGAPYAVLSKQRLGDRDVQITAPDLTRYAGMTPVLVDDIGSSGRTILAAAGELRRHGFAAPTCVIVHALFTDDAMPLLANAGIRIASTDTVAHPTNQISVAGLLADALTAGFE